MKNDVTKEWELYEKGKEYNQKINLYETVNKNERFYAGDQWHGVQSNGLPTPVFNVFKRVIQYFIAVLLSQKVKMKYSIENIPDNPEDEEQKDLLDIADKLSKSSELKWEKLKIDSLVREGLIDCANSADMAAYTFWDDTIDTGQTYGTEKILGDFLTELVDNVNVFFGNPNSNKVQKQPYILIAGRAMVSELRSEAKRNGIPEEQYKTIVSDEEYAEQAGDRGKIELNADEETGKCLYLIKLWKQNGHIFYNKSTKFCVIKKTVDTGLTLYPLAWMNWDRRKNSYHGQAVGTGMILNQIYINKQFAMVMKWMMDMAFGKVAYDSTRITSWSNAVGVAIPVNGDITGVVQQLQPGQMNSVVLEVIDRTMQYTKDLIGASDAALGNVDPKNTSAIIAVSQQAQIPLENVKANLYQFVEDLGLIWLDFMLNKYNVPRKIAYKEKGETQIALFNGKDYQNVKFSLTIDVGPSSYWSEITAMQTLDNLLQSEKINFVQYLERVPDGVIPKKQELIDELRQATQDNNLLYTQMEQFVQTLPPEIQAQLEQLRQQNPQEYEQQVKQMMMQSNMSQPTPQMM